MCFQNITDENQLKVADHLCNMNARNEQDFLLLLQNVIDRRSVQRREPTKCENHSSETVRLDTMC
jgi:hypothetical protein